MISGDFRYDQAVSGLSKEISTLLLQVPDAYKRKCYEVRMRINQPLVLTTAWQSLFVERSGSIADQPSPRCHIVDKRELDESILSLCAHSVHNHQQEFTQGYISVKGGHRAGVCGVAVVDRQAIRSVRDICSINLRIARQIKGAASELIRKAYSGAEAPVLLAGPPSSGKTTILRDLARQLSGGVTGRCLRISVIDERCEIGAVFEGIPQNDLGPCTDLLSGYPKEIGIQLAVRTLAPDMILCDEIGGKQETLAMLEGLNAGVKITATAHASNVEELMRREQIRILLENKVFEKIVLLENGGRIKEIFDVGELYGQNHRDGLHRPVLLDDRQGILSPDRQAGRVY